MKATDTFWKRYAINRPFASASSTVTDIGTQSSSSLNFLDGFPSVYESPISNGGKYVSRGDINALGKLASQTQFYFQAGGLNTFDREFVEKVGGYPKGAVLDWLVGNKLFKVMSLVDDNKVDFTAGDTDGEITEGRVDGVNWIFLNTDQVVDTTVEVAKIPNTIPPGCSTILTSFIAPKNGMLVIDGTYDVGPYPNVGTNFWLGVGLWAKKYAADMGSPKATGSTWNGWTPIRALVYFGYNGTMIDTTSFTVSEGEKYCIASTSAFQVTIGSTEFGAPILSNVDLKAYIV